MATVEMKKSGVLTVAMTMIGAGGTALMAAIQAHPIDPQVVTSGCVPILLGFGILWWREGKKMDWHKVAEDEGEVVKKGLLAGKNAKEILKDSEDVLAEDAEEAEADENDDDTDEKKDEDEPDKDEKDDGKE